MRPLLSRHRTLPALLAVAAATSFVVAAHGPAYAGDEITCRSTVKVWAARADMTLRMHTHNEPETGVDSWNPDKPVGSGWPAATWAGLDGRMYYLHAGTNTLERHRWNGVNWDNNGVSTPIRGDMGHYADPANAKRFTIDSTGAFYMVEKDGVLWRRTYDESTGNWNSIALGEFWNEYDAIFAAGDGVLWARQPSGAMFRFRYHAGSQRWLQYRQPITGIPWEQYKHLTSPGADVIYAIRRSDNAIIWFRYHEQSGHLTPGTQAGWWWGDSTTAVAAPDGCRRVDEPNPARPYLSTPDRPAKVTLFKDTNGSLHYAYIDRNGAALHTRVTDLGDTTPGGFTALSDESGFSGAPALGQIGAGDLRLWAQGMDADVRTFSGTLNGGWLSSANDYGRMLTAPQAVRTPLDNRTTVVALAEDGTFWAKRQISGGPLQPWRRLGTQAIAATKHFTVVGVGDTIHIVALRTSGDHCKLTVTRGAAGQWTCAGTDGTGAAAVVPMPDNTLQIFARRTDGKIHTTRFPSAGPIPATWTPLAGSDGADGDPAALLGSDGALQVVTRKADSYVYRTFQRGPDSVEWSEWREITNYTKESAVSPTVLLVQNSLMIAFRTYADEPLLWRL